MDAPLQQPAVNGLCPCSPMHDIKTAEGKPQSRARATACLKLLPPRHSHILPGKGDTMKTKTIVLVGSLMLACVAGGFLSGQWIASRQARHELAETTYAWFEKGAFRAGAFDARTSTWSAIWQEELGDQLK